MRILLVQHQSHGRRLFRHILSELGHDVVICPSRVELSGALETGNFHLVLVDRTLPDIQICDFIRQFRTNGATAASVIAVIVSHDLQHEIPAILNAGADDYLLLPTALAELQLRLRVLLNHAGRFSSALAGGSGMLTEHEGNGIFEAQPQAQPCWESPEAESADAVASMTFDHNGWIWMASPALAALLDVQPSGLIGQNIQSIIHESDLAAIPRLIARCATGSLRQRPARLRLRRSDGEWLSALAKGRHSSPVDGGTQQFIIEVDIIETGPPLAPERTCIPSGVCLDGRDEFLVLAEDLIVDRNLEREPIALLYISLDDFRALTQAHGYDTADIVLDKVTRRLMATLAPEDIFAKLGDGAFAALLSAPSDHARAAGKATRMIDALRSRPVRALQGKTISASASVGIALSGEDTKTIATLLRRADMAASVAKRAGRSRYEIFDPEIEIRNTSRLQIEQDLAQAVARDEFRVFYQPEIQLETGAIVGAEALVRWEHPENGLIMPGQFIELAEGAELIAPIGIQVLEKAARQAVLWRRNFELDEQFVIGVNFSMKQFQRPHIVDEVRAILHRAGLPPTALRIEITESSAIDHDSRILGALERLRKSGIHLAIDDFGTGYASLTQLRALPINTVKIDRSFISGSGTGSGQLSIARSVISMARSSGIDVVVEGIETSGQLKRILHSECTRGQGFYFSRPTTAETFEFWLKAGPRPFHGAISAARGDVGQPAIAGS